MDTASYKYFKYEITLGAPMPMPQPKIDWYPHNQHSIQQFLYTLCKEHIGALGKKDSQWVAGDEEYQNLKLSSRSDITQIFDFAEEMGIIEPGDAAGDFTAYKLSKTYWAKFDEHAS